MWLTLLLGGPQGAHGVHPSNGCHLGVGSLSWRQELVKHRVGSRAGAGMEECRGAHTSRDAVVALQGHGPGVFKCFQLTLW